MTPIEQVQHDLNNLRQSLSDFRKIQDNNTIELEHKFDRIIVLLEGDKSDPARGFIPRLIAIEKFMESMKNTKAYLMGNVAAAVFIISALGGIIAFCIKLYSYFNSK